MADMEINTTVYVSDAGNFRYCFKCADCIAVFFIEESDPNFARNIRQVECDCGGIASLMGRVHKERILKDCVAPACDGRCTSSMGPNCNCHCGGANHGTGAIVKYTKDVSNKIPKAHNDANIGVAIEWRDGLRDTAARMAKKYGAETLEKYLNGDWIGDLYCKVYKDYQKILIAKELKTHKGRMLKLASVCPELVES